MLSSTWRPIVTALRLIVVALVLLVELVAPLNSASGQTEQPADDWVALGPFGETPNAIAVSPGWPADPFLFAVLAGRPNVDGSKRGLRLTRSRDGGRSWEALPPPPVEPNMLPASALVGGRRSDGGHTLFLRVPHRGEGGRYGEGTLLRSTDDGDTWHQSHPGQVPLPTLSPAFAADGIALLSSDDGSLRSTDGGATWQPIELPPGQRLQSPQFILSEGAPLIVGALVSGPFPSASGEPGPWPYVDNEASVGVATSTDGGATWTATPGQPSIDGAPFRHVYNVAASPAFATDRTLFAFAWGPRELREQPGDRSILKSYGLFRSQDGGATWEPIRRSPLPPQSTPRVLIDLALSSSFADDQTVLMAVKSVDRSPASGHCSVERSTDGGRTVRTTRETGQYSWCSDIQFGPGPNGGIAWISMGNNMTTYRSRDGGQTWGAAVPPTGIVPYESGGGRAFLPDGTGFLAARGGVWAIGPSAVPGEGSLPCPAEVTGGFAQAFPTGRDARARLGCPIGPEHGVRIRERIGESSRDYWIEDASPFWYALRPAAERAGTAGVGDKLQQPWSGEPTRLIDGVVQYFDGGVMLWLPRPDSTPTIVTVVRGTTTTWQEFDDR
jgi:hypothetical protein